MRVIVNGEARNVAEGATLEDLVRDLGLEQTPCAAEVNRQVVPRDRRAETRLAEGDRVELVTLVGGG